MIETTISDISEHIGEQVKLSGWAYNFRSSGKIFFLQLRDGTGRIQAVYVKNDLTDEQWDRLQDINIESSIRVIGTVKQDDRSPTGFELGGMDIEIINLSKDDYPISKKEHGPDFLLDNRHLWLRSNKQWAIQKIRNTIIQSTYEYMNDNGFIKFDSPILTPSACEGTTELFEVEYFDSGNAYLSQSGQLYLEAGIMSLRRCFDFGPVFRAEKSKTRRHLTEFWMMDAEAAFVGHDENIKIQEELIIKIVKDVLEKNSDELKALERDVEPLKKVKAPFIRLTYKDAITKLQELGSDIGDSDDLGADDETMLTKEYEKPIFIERYPAEVKAFYMKRDPENPALVLNNDLLAPEGYGEIIGGSEREDNYDELLERIKEDGLPLEEFQWYLDLRRYGSVQHSGFGYGLERIVTWICGIHHLRETIPFPRMINRKTP